MIYKNICVSILQEDYDYIKKKRDSPSALLRTKIREDREKDGR